jgi:hypothetical protein
MSASVAWLTWLLWRLVSKMGSAAAAMGEAEVGWWTRSLRKSSLTAGQRPRSGG